MNLLSVSDAIEEILNTCQVVDPERIPTGLANGRVLAEDIYAVVDSPMFSNSGMDGYALVSEDSKLATEINPLCLHVIEDIPAGKIPMKTIMSGQAARIMTGAVMPKGANCVVPIEQIVQKDTPDDLVREEILIKNPLAIGDSVRYQGEDFAVGEHLLFIGDRIRAQDVAILAFNNIESILVYRKPRVAVLSTGDEVIDLGAEILQGKIPNSNMYALSSLLANVNCEFVDLGVAKDNYQDVVDHLDMAVEKEVDLIISSAGVSVGEYDFVRKVIEEQGELSFWRVNMRPGKPLAFGRYHQIPIVGLPGNPVSSFVGFKVFLEPYLKKASGMNDANRTAFSVTLEDDIQSDGRESYLRASFYIKDGIIFARLTGHQGSGNLLSLVRADGLIIIPADVKNIKAGQKVEAFRFQ